MHGRHLWRTLFERWRTGPALSVQVTTSSGTPVEAWIRLEELQLRAGERWRTHGGHGWHHQLLPQAGTYTVEVEAGGTRVQRRVEVGEGPTQLRIQLPEVEEEGPEGDSGLVGH